MDRKKFIQSSGLITSAMLLGINRFNFDKNLKLSLSQWALHRTIFGNSKEDYQKSQKNLHTNPEAVLQGTLDPLDFPKIARTKYNFEAVEYVNTFFFGKKEAYFKKLKKRSEDAGVNNLLIMVDEEGLLGHPDKKKRLATVERHRKWLKAAAILGCHSIRVNAHSKGNKTEQKKFCADGLSRICDYAKDYNLDILVENHGGMSSEPNWLIDTIKATGKSNIATMVDFDNFQYSEKNIWNGESTYNRYKGVEILMPFAKSVSVKSYDFNNKGIETTINFKRMIDIVKKSNFNGHLSVEYEGHNLSEKDGIIATKKLLEKYD